jgi:hypothetical protein
MAKHLRKRVTRAILVPVVLGLILIAIVTCLPVYIVYQDYISQYNEHMITNEEHNLLLLNKAVANSESYGIILYSASLVNLIAGFLNKFYCGQIIPLDQSQTLIINQTQSENRTNGNQYAIGHADISNITSDPEYFKSSSFYYFIQPIIGLASKYEKTVTAFHLTFSDDFFVFFPANCTLYEEFVNRVSSYNTSLWWNVSSEINQTGSVAFVYSEYKMICESLYIDYKLTTLPCIVYDLSYLARPLMFKNTKKSIVIADKYLNLYYPYSNQSYCEYQFQSPCPTLVQSYDKIENDLNGKFKYKKLENSYQNLSESEILVLNAFKQQSQPSALDFSSGGIDYIISVVPLNMTSPIISSQGSYFSIGMQTTKEQISRKFDVLSRSLTITIIIQLSVFLVVLIGMISMVCVISYKITSSVIAPIDELHKILQKLHTDLGVDVLSHLKRGPPEIIDLYQVFDQLRLILRFQDGRLFKDPTYAMMNYAQALRLFHSFNNKCSMEKCFEEIGKIHMDCQRYNEAAVNFYCSYQLAEEIQLSPFDIALKKVNAGKAMIKAGIKLEKAKNLFCEALKYYDTQDLRTRISNYLEFTECLLNISQDPVDEMESLEELIKEIEEKTEDCILIQKYLYLKGLRYYNLNSFRLSAEFLTESIESPPIVHRETRTKSLSLLKKIFKKFKIPIDQVLKLENSMKICPKDVALVVDSKIGSHLNQEYLQNFLDHIITTDDRLSFIQFDENFQVLLNLTKLPGRRYSTSASMFDRAKECVLNDAILAGLRQIVSIKSMLPESFISNNSQTKEWIVVITHGEDHGSKVSYYSLLKELYQATANLVIIAVTPEEHLTERLKSLVNVTPLGLLIPVYDFSGIEMGLLQAAAYISESKDILI